MKLSAKQIKPFTSTVSELARVSEYKTKRQATIGNGIAGLFGRNREVAMEHRQRLQAGLDKTYELKISHEAVTVRPAVQNSLPNILITDSPTGKPEIAYGINLHHKASAPQSLVFEKQPEGTYTMTLHHYVEDGRGLVADLIDFDALSTEQQGTITAMVNVINERYEQNPHNFEVRPMPSPYVAK